MSYTHYTHTKWYEDSYENNVQWVKSQYEEYGDRIVFSNISPNEDGFMSSVIVKDLQESETQTQQS
jgi:uncharacterized protein YgiM (DUF1202 family)